MPLLSAKYPTNTNQLALEPYLESYEGSPRRNRYNGDKLMVNSQPSIRLLNIDEYCPRGSRLGWHDGPVIGWDRRIILQPLELTYFL